MTRQESGVARGIRVLVIVLAAALATSALAASAASAKPPRWFLCEAHAGGKFEDSLCAKAVANGSFEEKELASGVRETFKSHLLAGTEERLITRSSGGSVLLEIRCKKEVGKGFLEGKGATSPGTDVVESDESSECKVTVPSSGCGVEEPIKLEPNIPSELAWKEASGPAALDRGWGIGSSQKFTTIKITGTFCFFKGTHETTGEILEEVKPVGKYANPGELISPCPKLRKYWTGDSPSRTETTLAHPLTVAGLEGFASVEVCGEGEVEFAKDAVAVKE